MRQYERDARATGKSNIICKLKYSTDRMSDKQSDSEPNKEEKNGIVRDR